MTTAVNDQIKTPFSVLKLVMDGGTQLRVKTDDDQIEAMKDLIEMGVTWSTPIQIAEFEGRFYPTNGFHRVIAYQALGIEEIPAHNYEIIQCKTRNDMIDLALDANEDTGLQSTKEDRIKKVRVLMEMDPEKYILHGKVNANAVMSRLKLSRAKLRLASDEINAELGAATDALFAQMFEQGREAKEISEKTGLSLSTVYERIAALKKAAEEDEAEADSEMAISRQSGNDDEEDEDDDYFDAESETGLGGKENSGKSEKKAVVKDEASQEEISELKAALERAEKERDEANARCKELETAASKRIDAYAIIDRFPALSIEDMEMIVDVASKQLDDMLSGVTYHAIDE